MTTLANAQTVYFMQVTDSKDLWRREGDSFDGKIHLPVNTGTYAVYAFGTKYLEALASIPIILIRSHLRKWKARSDGKNGR
jgi:hypothetical protein